MTMIEFSHVRKRFGETPIFEDLNLTVDTREVVVVIGPSGSGKSTLLRCINALETIEGGDIRVDGFSVKGGREAVRQIRLEAGMVFQQFNLFPQMTALQNVMFGPIRARGVSRGEAREAALALLAKVGLSDRANYYPAQLSGGQQQRVAIARALAVRPKLMLFDEPTSALDPELRQEVLKVMQTLAEEGMTMVIVTHEIAFARKAGTRLVFMDAGRIVHDGRPDEMLSQPPSARLRDFLQHVA